MKKNILITGLIIVLLGVLMFVFIRTNEREGEKSELGQEREKKVEEQTITKESYMDYIITLKTNMGEIKFETYAREAPNTVENFVTLANKGFYDKVIFHRVIDGFMKQGGDPTGTGMGGPGYVFDDEISPSSKIYQQGYLKGIVAMANAGPNTQGSQFFIMVKDYPLPPLYTIFGKVISGQEVAEAISLVEKDASDRPLEEVIIESVSVSEKE